MKIHSIRNGTDKATSPEPEPDGTPLPIFSFISIDSQMKPELSFTSITLPSIIVMVRYSNTVNKGKPKESLRTELKHHL